MSGKEALSNVAYFLETILPEAYSSQKWNKETLDQAFKWAEYCEQMHKNVRNHPKAEEIDKIIKSIGAALDRGSPGDVCLEYLKYSTELLFKAFLQNERLEYTLRQAVVEYGKRKELDIAKLIDEDSEMRSLCNDVLSSANLLTNSRKSYVSVIDEIEAELLLGYIKKQTITLKTEKEMEEALVNFLDESYMKKQLKIILDILLLKTEAEAIENLLQKIFLKHLCQKANTQMDSFDPKIIELTLKQPVCLLRCLAVKESDFYECYVDMLVKSAQNMEFKDDTAVWELLESSTWSLTFDELVAHFKCLCSSHDEVSKRTEDILDSFVKDAERSRVWEHIVQLLSKPHLITNRIL